MDFRYFVANLIVEIFWSSQKQAFFRSVSAFLALSHNHFASGCKWLTTAGHNQKWLTKKNLSIGIRSKAQSSKWLYVKMSRTLYIYLVLVIISFYSCHIPLLYTKCNFWSFSILSFWQEISIHTSIFIFLSTGPPGLSWSSSLCIYLVPFPSNFFEASHWLSDHIIEELFQIGLIHPTFSPDS